VAASVLLARTLDSALSELVTPGVEPSPALGAIVGTGAPTGPTTAGAAATPSGVGGVAVDGSGVAQATQVTATIAFMDHDGSVRSLSCRTDGSREGWSYYSAYFPDAAHAMAVYTRLCAATQPGTR
jgi:hypothetical protein